MVVRFSPSAAAAAPPVLLSEPGAPPLGCRSSPPRIISLRSQRPPSDKQDLFFPRGNDELTPFAVFQERSNRLQRQEGRNRKASPLASLLPPRLDSREARALQTVYCSLQEQHRKARTVHAQHMAAPQTASRTARSLLCSSYLFSEEPAPLHTTPTPTTTTQPPPPAPQDSIRKRAEWEENSKRRRFCL